MVHVNCGCKTQQAMAAPEAVDEVMAVQLAGSAATALMFEQAAPDCAAARPQQVSHLAFHPTVQVCAPL